MAELSSLRRSMRLRKADHHWRSRGLSESQLDTQGSRVVTRSSTRRKNSCEKATLLSLPDDQLSFIMDLLKSSDSSGSFQEPRHAFALAMTNTRFLALFKRKITKIVPDLSNPTPPTLSSAHILSVSRLAGPNLREIHFTTCFDDTLKYLSLAFPRLEALTFDDRPDLCRDGLGDMLRRSLQSLSITNPTPECLENIVPRPPKLSLLNVMEDGYIALTYLLREPPRSLNLAINLATTTSLLDTTFSTRLTVLRLLLADALPQMEALCIMPSFQEEEGRFDDFAGRAAELIRGARTNSQHSICTWIRITGSLFFHLLNRVNSTAVIELSDGRETFFDSGDGTQARKLVLGDNCVETDISRLQEVIIGENCSASWEKWKELLSTVKLHHALVLDVRAAKHLCLSIKIVDIPVQYIGTNRQWAWLHGVQELNLIGADGGLFREEQLNIFRGVSSMLRFFHGNVLWISEFEPGWFIPNCNDAKTRRAVKALVNAVKEFEKDGGDAGTVKSMINCALTRWSIRRSDL